LYTYISYINFINYITVKYILILINFENK